VTYQGQAWISRVAFVVGVVLAAAVVAAGAVPQGGRELRAELKVSATATGGLAITPESRVLARGRLAPGTRPVRARVKLLNQTSRAVSVLVRASSTEHDLDDSVRVELRAGHGRPLRATLGQLRRWRRIGPSLEAHRREPVALRIWIPRSDGGYEGRRSDVTLEFLRRGASA
jgi:hypothetical protein